MKQSLIIGIIAIVVVYFLYKRYEKSKVTETDKTLRKTTLEDLLNKGYDYSEAQQILSSENVLSSGTY
ncbi:MAG: hypothetical protein HYU67_04670 [Flavobacteriia bacterium]|nr:hypothetical protein [Flavobacteriia bacterium]